MWDDYKLLNRFAIILLILSGITLLIVGWRAIGNRSVFTVRAFIIHGDTTHLTQSQLTDLALVKLRGNFFSVDLMDLKQGFEALPWVKAVSLRRRWPLMIAVNITAFHAVARWGDSSLIGTDGQLFSGATAQHLPILWGPAQTEREVFEQYLLFQKVFKNTGLTIEKLVLSEHYSWSMQLSGDITVELGRNTPAFSVSQKAQRFILAYPTLMKQLHAEKKRITKVDLRYPEGFAINITGA